jgi:hypothetical protein
LETTLPRWFIVPLAGSLAFVATAGFAGICLLIAHKYQPLSVWIVATTAALATAVVVAKSLNPARRAAHAPAIASLFVALTFLAITGVMHSEHLLVDNDPSVYLNSGRSLAATQSLAPRVRSGPFVNHKYVVSSPGFDEVSGKLQPSFLPMLSVLLALGWTAGGYSGFFLVAPLLGALGLLVCYALSTRVVGPRWALLIPLLLAINPLQSWFARDDYSELVVQMVALGGLWLYLEARVSTSPGLAATAGALIASCLLARIDTLAVVAAVVGFAAVDYTRCDDAERPASMKRFVATFGLVLLGMTIFCGRLSYTTSRSYVDAQAGSTRLLILALLAAVVIGAVFIISHGFRPGLGRRFARARLPFALACAFVGAASVWAYALRPVHERTASLRAESTWSMRWLVAWFGITFVAGAVCGILVLFRRALRADVAATALVVLVVPLAVIYLWAPRVSPDQPWAMRRFLPVVIPGFVIAVVALLQSLTIVARRTRERRFRMPALVMVFGLVVATFAPSVLAAAPLVEARAQHGALAAVKTLCRTLPGDAAVAMYRASEIEGEMMQTIRGFCEVPTARAEIGSNLVSLARSWRDAGRSLFVVTTSPREIERETSGIARVILHLKIDDRYAPQLTYRVRPRHFDPHPRQLWLMRVGPTR